jgi:hypothetical protein
MKSKGLPIYITLTTNNFNEKVYSRVLHVAHFVIVRLSSQSKMIYLHFFADRYKKESSLGAQYISRIQCARHCTFNREIRTKNQAAPGVHFEYSFSSRVARLPVFLPSVRSTLYLI